MNTSQKPQYDPLDAFVRWYLETPMPCPPSVYFGGVTKVGDFTGLVLCRQGQFQAELWLCAPNSEIPDHSHPGIDTVQTYVTGDVHLRLNGKPALEEMIGVLQDGRCSHNGRWIRVRPTDTHGAKIGPLGGAFINFQHWLRGEAPTSAALDWRGEVLSKDHRAMLVDRGTAASGFTGYGPETERVLTVAELQAIDARNLREAIK